MNVIYKYQIFPGDMQVLEIPQDSKILCVQTQGGEPQMWVQQYTEGSLTQKEIYIIPTGATFDADDKKYIGTFQLNGGTLVFHVYESVF